MEGPLLPVRSISVSHRREIWRDHSYTTNLDRYILNSVAINVKMYRSRPEFCLMTSEATPNFEVVIEDIALKACKLQVLSSIIMAHAEKLKTTNAKYPFTRTEVRLISIAAGSLSFNNNNLFNGLRPIRVS